MAPGDFGRGLSRNRVIFPRNFRHYRESGVPFRESDVFYRAAGDRCPSNSQHYRKSATSWRESDVFSRSAGNPPWVGAPGGRRGPPGPLSGPRRGRFAPNCRRLSPNLGNSAIFQRRGKNARLKSSSDCGREAVFRGTCPGYREFSRVFPPRPRIRAVKYDVGCKAGAACSPPRCILCCFPGFGGGRLPRRTRKPCTFPREHRGFAGKHHAIPHILPKVPLGAGEYLDSALGMAAGSWAAGRGWGVDVQASLPGFPPTAPPFRHAYRARSHGAYRFLSPKLRGGACSDGRLLGTGELLLPSVTLSMSGGGTRRRFPSVPTVLSAASLPLLATSGRTVHRRLPSVPSVLSACSPGPSPRWVARFGIPCHADFRRYAPQTLPLRRNHQSTAVSGQVARSRGRRGQAWRQG